MSLLSFTLPCCISFHWVGRLLPAVPNSCSTRTISTRLVCRLLSGKEEDGEPFLQPVRQRRVTYKLVNCIWMRGRQRENDCLSEAGAQEQSVMGQECFGIRLRQHREISKTKCQVLFRYTTPCNAFLTWIFLTNLTCHLAHGCLSPLLLLEVSN